MIKRKYLRELNGKIQEFTKDKQGMKVFIFGSSLEKERFGDIDLGVIGEFKPRDIVYLKEEFEESTFPYFVDIIDFNKVSDSFKNNVFKNKILWAKH